MQPIDGEGARCPMAGRSPGYDCCDSQLQCLDQFMACFLRRNTCRTCAVLGNKAHFAPEPSPAWARAKLFSEEVAFVPSRHSVLPGNFSSALTGRKRAVKGNGALTHWLPKAAAPTCTTAISRLTKALRRRVELFAIGVAQTRDMNVRAGASLRLEQAPLRGR